MCPSCHQGHIWIKKPASHPNLKMIGSVLEDIIRDHLQFTDKVISKARTSMHNVEKKIRLQNNDLRDIQYVGVHVRY